MSRTIRIEPLTRIEGNGKVTVHLDDAGKVTESRFTVQEFRGFEKFCEGRMFWEMPLITPRICGVCPVSHHLASAKACDALLGLEIPEAAKLARELMHLAGLAQDHALHFFFLAGPDLLLGPASDPALRNVVGLVQADAELAKMAIAMRRGGQQMVARLGGPQVHPVTAIPGGMSKPLTEIDRMMLKNDLAALAVGGDKALELAKQAVATYAEHYDDSAAAPAYFAGQVGPDGELALYDGTVRFVDSGLAEVARFAPADYKDTISESVETWSYAKFPYLADRGFPEGAYRVGPLARLNAATSIATPKAQSAFEEYRAAAGGRGQTNSFYYHWARMIELVHAVERMEEILADPALTSGDARVRADRNTGRGVGIIEAPRGLLIHDFTSDPVGRLTDVNLVVATTHNNQAINRTVGAAAERALGGGEPDDAAFNHIETAIRCFDPCLSCSTHQVGKMPLTLEVVRDGRVRTYVRRS